MRRSIVVAALVAGSVSVGGVAAACEDCDFDWYEPAAFEFEAPAFEAPAFELSDGPGDAAPAYEPPAYEPPVYEPPAYETPAVYEPPTYEPPVVAAIEAGPTDERMVATEPPPPAAVPTAERLEPILTAADQAAARGLSLVTLVHAGDFAVTHGDTTTFGSTVVAEVPGTYAKKVAEVGSGVASGLDGLSTNARMRLSDGRGVAGSYYETFLCDPAGCVSLGFTFFADDSETSHVAAPVIVPPEIATPSVIVVPVSISPPVTASPTAVTPSFVEGAIPGGGDAGTAAVPPASGSLPPAGAQGPTIGQRGRDVRAAVALGPLADALGSVEVLRGRRIAMWLRATVDGAPARVLSWRLRSGELVALGPVAGGGDDPLVATWRTLARRGGAFAVTFDVSVDVPGEGARPAGATIAVVVRSPALVE